MSLLDDLANLETEAQRAGGPVCGISRLLSGLEEAEGLRLVELIDHSRVYSTRIAQALQKNGHKISAAQVQHHRRRLENAGCRCPKENT